MTNNRITRRIVKINIRFDIRDLSTGFESTVCNQIHTTLFNDAIFTNSLYTWVTEFLEHQKVKNCITDLCKKEILNMKQKYMLGSKGYTVEIISYREEPKK